MTSFAQEEISLRRAVLADKEAVMSLGDMYSGRDYLSALYSELVESPDTYPVVAVINEKVVGFYMTTTFDGGKTIMKRAGRVDESFRGRGLFKLMEEELERHTAHRRLQAVYETLANTDKVDHLADRFLSKGYNSVYRKGVINKLLRLSDSSTCKPPSSATPTMVELIEKSTFAPPTRQDLIKESSLVAPPTKLQVDNDSQPSAPPTKLEVYEMNPEALSILFKAETSKARLFPQKRLFNFFLGYRLQDENIPLLLEKRGGAFYSMDTKINVLPKDKDMNDNVELTLNNSGNSKNYNNHFSETNNTNAVIRDNPKEELTLRDAQHVAMVTFYYFFPTRTGFLYFIDVYAAPQLSNSSDHLVSHLQRHLRVATRHFHNTDGILTLAFDLHLSRDTIASTLDRYGISDDLPGQESFQILYERRVEKDG